MSTMNTLADTQLQLTVGIRPPHGLFEGGARSLRAGVAAIEASGIDRVCVGDHVAFHGGRGFDGLVQASALAALSDCEVQTAIYLLPLRHPVPVARQVNSLVQIAPGRFVFGVGIGGEDPAEVRLCGVDPTTRGRRMNESLMIIRALLAGETVTFDGEFFQIDEGRMLPVPPVPVPIVVGGRSAAALCRAGRLGDGWLALWTSPARFVQAVAEVEAYASAAGRGDVAWRHGLQVWCGFGPSREQARGPLAKVMEALYKTPFEKFERYSPYGTAADVAAELAPFLEAGCRDINVIPAAASAGEATEGVAEVRRLLIAAQ
jgi:alkanesulfonate monooxygenase SsuD/methylene tetrahydromethanopterin reductase-like flavin-dependent oxidoreductase (luciferase family)